LALASLSTNLPKGSNAFYYFLDTMALTKTVPDEEWVEAHTSANRNSPHRNTRITGNNFSEIFENQLSTNIFIIIFTRAIQRHCSPWGVLFI
jgi:hypothetical protein